MNNEQDTNTGKYMITATLKNESEINAVYDIFPHNLTMVKVQLTGMIAVDDEDGRTILRSRERMRIIELNDEDEDKVLFVTEEFNYLLATCAFLNDYEITYLLDSSITKLTAEYCLSTTIDNLDDRIEENS